MANLQKPRERRYVGVRETVLYGVANGGQVIGYNMVRMQLTFYLVTVFGIPAPAVATMIFFMGLWDAFNDPIMGMIVDRTRTRHGKLRPFLLFVPIPLGIATVVFFGGAQFLSHVQSDALKIVYMCITYFLWEFLYTIGDIPFWGLSAAISPNPEDRSRVITSARFISSIIGGLPSILISVCIDLYRNGVIPWDLRQVFLFLGVIAGTVGMGLFSLVLYRPATNRKSATASVICLKTSRYSYWCFPLYSVRSAGLPIPLRSISMRCLWGLQVFPSWSVFPGRLRASSPIFCCRSSKNAGAPSRLSFAWRFCARL